MSILCNSPGNLGYLVSYFKMSHKPRFTAQNTAAIKQRRASTFYCLIGINKVYLKSIIRFYVKFDETFFDFLTLKMCCMEM